MADEVTLHGRVLVGGAVAATWKLEVGESLVFGRDPDSDVVLADRAISQRHFRLQREGLAVAVTDLGSLQGVEFEGRSVTQARLEPGQELRVGRFRIQLLDEQQGQAPGELLLSQLGSLLREENLAPTAVLGRLLEGLVTALEADRAFVFEAEVGRDFRLAQAYPANLKVEQVSRSLLLRVRDTQVPLLLTTAETQEVRQEIESVGGELRSIVLAPLATPEGPRIVYLDSRYSRRRFSETDRSILQAYLTTAMGILANDAARRRAASRAERLAALQSRSAGRVEILGDSPVIREVLNDLGRAAQTPVNVLIHGESGTGKELAARVVHRDSDRASGPFVPVNCAALPKDLVESELFGYEAGAFSGAGQAKLGLFELADGGTLFLDEVGELPLESQGKLLRAVQERRVRRLGAGEDVPVDFRLVCATNRDLREAQSRREFREDLYYRISTFQVRMPPLRERGADVALLAEAFLRDITRDFGRSQMDLDAHAAERLSSHPWPGNVRELRNVLEQAVIRTAGSRISCAQVEPALGGITPVSTGSGEGLIDVDALPDGLAEARRIFERVLVRRALRGERGNMQRAAARLGLARKSLYAKCKDLGIEPGEFRPPRGETAN